MDQETARLEALRLAVAVHAGDRTVKAGYIIEEAGKLVDFIFGRAQKTGEPEQSDQAEVA